LAFFVAGLAAPLGEWAELFLPGHSFGLQGSALNLAGGTLAGNKQGRDEGIPLFEC
jgi:hypothetical protein